MPTNSNPNTRIRTLIAELFDTGIPIRLYPASMRNPDSLVRGKFSLVFKDHAVGPYASREVIAFLEGLKLGLGGAEALSENPFKFGCQEPST